MAFSSSAEADPKTLLSQSLKSLIHQAVKIFGRVVEKELGLGSFQQIEALRQEMASLRESSDEKVFASLKKNYRRLEKLNRNERLEVARAFTLMLEVMNACENAYRSYRLSLRKNISYSGLDLESQSVTYVFTAHPTEARSPLNIEIFHQIQNLLLQALQENPDENEFKLGEPFEKALFHLLAIAWRTPIVRSRAPTASDEAAHIYSLLLRDEILFSLLDTHMTGVPFFIHNWAGGDKDGHPGVDEKVMLRSLSLSRIELVHVILKQMRRIHETLNLFSSHTLSRKLVQIENKIRGLKILKAGDGPRVEKVKKMIQHFSTIYEQELGALHPDLLRLHQILRVLPGIVVPLELREASDVLMAKSVKTIVIDRMLATIARLAGGCDPRLYAHSFIISMTESFAHVQKAAQKQKAAFGEVYLPIVPLFENAKILQISDSIVSKIVKNSAFKKLIRNQWGGQLEIMVGYSDSAKEAGVLNSRLAIAEALPRLDKVCARNKVTPVFFHGSGGSIDRGGGSIEDQTSWWPQSALRNYKATVQGEMIERSLATTQIAQRMIQKIVIASQHSTKRLAQDLSSLGKFAEDVAESYRERTHSAEFLEMVESATPYSFLNLMKIGSRPSKRSKKLSVEGLRAIPWVLCWTQPRILLPTWWGVGSAWEKATAAQKAGLKKAFRETPVFSSYMRALGFTLAKIEMPVWRLYLEKSSLSSVQAEKFFAEFSAEHSKTLRCFHEMTGHDNLLWFRPWLGESIYLRSVMIHPLNLLQILASQDNDIPLIRTTMVGISSGMLTTG